MSTLDIRDIKGPILIQGVSTPLLLAGLFSILLVGLLILFWVKIKKKRAPRPIPPHEIAIAALERLGRKGLSEEKGMKDYFSELSQIIREYLDRRVCGGILEMTLEECLGRVRESKIVPDATCSLLENLLTHCDLVKFARWKPSPEEMNSSFQMAQIIVEETKEPSHYDL
jgi:hypothetical protein